ncbi:MAG: hypothetical protein ACE5Q6_10865 [Dehalococcoidia bacterium]
MGFFEQIYISAPVLGATIAGVLIVGAVLNRDLIISSPTDGFLVGIAVVVFSISSAAAPFAYELTPIYGIIQFFLVLLSAVLILVSLTNLIEDTDKAFVLFIGTLIVPVVLLLVAIPVAVLPYFRSDAPSSPPPLASTEIRTEAITESFSRIKDTLNEIDKDIALESENIDQSIEKLTKEIDARNEELRTLVEEQSRMAEEVDTLRELANLSEKQADAVVEALNRGKTRDKFLDYAVGFGLGLLSSGFFFVIQRFGPRRH